jgi:putative Holliday junction resolvase
MDRIICLDVGSKRVGVAVSDPLGLTAQPAGTIDRKPHGLFLEKISSLSKKFETKAMVLGLPRRTDGKLGPEAQAVMALAHELAEKLSLQVETFDERLTTVLAHRQLDEAGVKGRAREAAVDQAAAAIILTGYLHRQGAGDPGAARPAPLPGGQV